MAHTGLRDRVAPKIHPLSRGYLRGELAEPISALRNVFTFTVAQASSCS